MDSEASVFVNARFVWNSQVRLGALATQLCLVISAQSQEHTETLLDELCEAQPAPPSWSGEAPRLLSEDDAVAANARRRDGLY